MKFWKKTTLFKRRLSKLLRQKGQTLVEFVLLLAVISSISYAFVAIMNSNIGNVWEHSVNMVVNDGDPSKPKLKID